MPSQYDYLRANQVTQLIKGGGSFWSEMTKDKEPIRILPELAGRVRLFNQLEEGFGRLLSNSDQAFVEDIHMGYDPATVTYGGNVFYDGTAVYEDDGALYNKSGSQYMWSLPLDSNIYPIAIMSPTKGELLNSREFFVYGDRIYFLLRPADLFQKNKILVSAGIQSQKSIYRWQLNFEELNKNHYTVQFARTQQSAGSFRLAVAELAGLKIVNETSELLSKHGSAGGSVSYKFSNQSVTVPYAHAELTVGLTYEAGTIIGDGLKVTVPDVNDSRWWRKANWSRGLSLSGITGYPGLYVPDEDCWAYVTDADSGSIRGSKLHTRLNIPGDGGSETANYWSFVHQNETSFGQYLNSVIGLGDESTDDTDYDGLYDRWIAEDPDMDFDLLFDSSFLGAGVPPAAKKVNPIDMLFEALLKHTATIITLDLGQIENHEEVIRFIYRELPVGVTPIINLIQGAQNDIISSPATHSFIEGGGST